LLSIFDFLSAWQLKWLLYILIIILQASVASRPYLFACYDACFPEKDKSAGRV